MDGSKRSGHGNAYFTGIGASKRIVFYDTLLKSLDSEEIESVLAHELGHFRHKHVMKRMIWMALSSLAGFAVLGALIDQPWFYNGLGVQHPSHPAALVLFVLTAPVFVFFTQPLSPWWMRRHEFQADDFASTHTNPAYLISALVKLYEENAATLTPDPLYSAYHNSHPPAPVRIAHLSAKLGRHP
jgi:STE24 endopeptidase